MKAWVAALLVLGACGDDPIDVRKEDGSEYKRTELEASVAKFVAAGRTPAAYGVLAREVTALRPGMDETVAELAELDLVTLGVAPVESVRALPPSAQTEALAKTVWPIAIAPPFDVLAADGWRDPREAPIALKEGETADAYVQRMCGGPYAADCKYIVPEFQGAVLGAEAIAQMTQRARTAVANCEECSDPAWHRAVARWESLDHAATTTRERLEAAGATSRWPVAGAAASPPAPASAQIEIEPDGDWILEGAPISPSRRVDVIADRRAGASPAALAVHLRPDARLERLEQAVALAFAAGYTHVLIEARADAYPWPLLHYRLPAQKKPKLGRAGDTLQIFLRSRD